MNVSVRGCSRNSLGITGLGYVPHDSCVIALHLSRTVKKPVTITGKMHVK